MTIDVLKRITTASMIAKCRITLKWPLTLSLLILIISLLTTSYYISFLLTGLTFLISTILLGLSRLFSNIPLDQIKVCPMMNRW